MAQCEDDINDIKIPFPVVYIILIGWGMYTYHDQKYKNDFEAYLNWKESRKGTKYWGLVYCHQLFNIRH